MGYFGALGDIHGDFDAARRIMARHSDIHLWLCAGDVADDEGRYEPLPAPLYWIKGNKENFDAIRSGAFPLNLRFIRNAHPVEVEGLRVVGLGGTHAPTWFDTPAAELPYPAPAGHARVAGGPRPADSAVRDDKRRHFVREEVTACQAVRDVDVLLTHEAPRPFRIGRLDAGKTPINDVLASVKPRLHLFGHHHRFSEQQPQGIRSVGLDLASRSYLLIDRTTLEYELRTA